MNFGKKMCCLPIIQDSRFGGSPINLNSSGCRTFTPKELQWRHWKLSLHTQESLLKPKKIVQKTFILPNFFFGLPSLHFRFGVPLFVCFTNPKNPTHSQPKNPPTPPDADSLPSTAEAPASGVEFLLAP